MHSTVQWLKTNGFEYLKVACPLPRQRLTLQLSSSPQIFSSLLLLLSLLLSLSPPLLSLA